MPIVKSSTTPFWQNQLNLANLRLPWVMVTLLVLAGLVKLGLWQTERAEEKEQRLLRISTLSGQQALSLEALTTQPNYPIENELSKSTIENYNDFPVLLEGSFDENALFLLDNQVNNGRLGYKVLQVFHSKKHSVLVNLGWVQGSIDRQEIPDVALLRGEHRFNGHLRYPEEGFMLMAQDYTKAQWPMRIQQIELAEISRLLKKPLFPFVVYVDKQQSLGYVKNWQPIVMPPEKHHGYAFQWFSLALAWLLLMCWVSGIFKGSKRQQNHHEKNK